MDKNKKNAGIKEVENVVNEKTTEKTDKKVSKPKKEGVAETSKKLEDMTTQEINELIKKVEAKNYKTPTTTLEEAEERAGKHIDLTIDGTMIKKDLVYGLKGDLIIFPLLIIGLSVASYFLIHFTQSVFWNIVISILIGLCAGSIISRLICGWLFKIYATEEEKLAVERTNAINTLEKKLNLVKLPYHLPTDYHDSPKTKFVSSHTIVRCPKCGHQLKFLNGELRGSEGEYVIGAYNYTHFTPDKIGERRKIEYECSKCKLHITEIKKTRQFFKIERNSDYNDRIQWTEIEFQYSTPDNVDPSISSFLKKYSGKAHFNNREEIELHEKEEQRKIKSGENW